MKLTKLRAAIIQEIEDSNTDCCALTPSVLHDVISFESACTLHDIKAELKKLTDEGVLRLVGNNNGFTGRAYAINPGHKVTVKP